MIVLSCFDGMSCGRIALERAGFKISKYYASEIDPYAIKVTMANYPDTVQLGSISDWKSWNILQPDLIIAGSPCQGFSIAGKQLNFNDPRSALFFVFTDILKFYKPKFFLLENVKMKKEYQNIISQQLAQIYPEAVSQTNLFKQGRLDPIEINSSLLSAQNRIRLYWTNIPNITPPKDKGILLKDILEEGIVDRDKAHCLDANYYKGASKEQYKTKHRRQLKQCIQVGEPKVSISQATINKYIPDVNAKYCDPYNKKTISTEKSTALRLNSSNGNMWVNDKLLSWRKLTPIECERLQTVPDNYTSCVSNTQRYKMLGNGWTVDVISHILSFM